MIGKQGLAGLREEILAEANREAAEEIRVADEAAEVEHERAEAAGRREREAILRQARNEAEALRRRTGSVTAVEVKKRLLEVREQLIQRVLDEAAAALRQPLPAPEQRELLLRLIVEAAQEVGGGKADVHVAPADRPLLTPDLLREAERRLAERGAAVQLAPANEPLPVANGVVLSKDGGRVLVDNTLEARLRRREDALRAEVWRALAVTETSGQTTEAQRTQGKE